MSERDETRPSVHDSLQRVSENGSSRLLGDPMEAALLEMAQAKLGREAWLPKLDELPFDADRRRMSTLHDGMLYCKGAPEAVPFSERAAAQSFQAAHKGRVVRLAEIPDAYVLGPVDVGGAAAPEHQGARAHPGAPQ